MPIGEFLRKSAQHHPDKTALIGRQMRVTYAEFDRQADRLAGTLNDLNLGHGARIALLSTNRPEYGIAYFAIARTPYISVHCSTRSTVDDLVYVLNKTGVAMLVTETKFLPIVYDALPRLKAEIPVVLFDPPAETTKLSNDVQSFNELIANASELPSSYEPDETDGLAITFTGGTTGSPKAVLVTHKARRATALAAAGGFGLRNDDILLASTPLFHTVGLFVWFSTGVLLGATIVLPEEWSPEGFMDLIEREKITAAFLVPSQLNALVSHAEFSATRLATLRNIGYAGAPMGRALYDRIQSALPHVEFTENYGQSEACPLTIRHADDGTDKLGTVGKPVPGTEIAIVDRHGNLLSPGMVGDVAARGETVFQEYLNDPGETEQAFRLGNGWLLTGDIGVVDENGFLTLVDRSKDMLISGGENIYPAEIENALYQHEAVRECAVFGVPDEHWGEVPAAHVVVAPGAEITESELIEFCATRIARFKRPRMVRFVDSLPKTTVGKIRKNVLREPYWAAFDQSI